MKLLIKYAIELDISNIRTFRGYNGGDILQLGSYDKEVISLLKSFCHHMEVDTNVKRVPKTSQELSIYCHFGVDRYKVDDHLDTFDLKN